MRPAARPLPFAIVVASACTPTEPPAENAPAAVEPVEAAAVVERTPAPAPAAEPKPLPAAPCEPERSWVDASPIAGANWLVWSGDGHDFVTRWIVTSGRELRLAGERDDLVVGAGERLWQIEVRDDEMPLYSCECYDLEDDKLVPGCRPTSRITMPSLRATDLESGAVTELVKRRMDPAIGDAGGRFDVSITGGVGSSLFVDDSERGYFCGAHPVDEHLWRVYDVTTGFMTHVSTEALVRGLPKSVTREAEATMREAIELCFDVDARERADAIGRTPFLDRVSVHAAAGAISIEWELGRNLPEGCGPEDATYGTATTGLLPQAAALGLADPLPPAVVAAVADIGDAAAVGWARLELSGAAAQHMLDRFRVPMDP